MTSRFDDPRSATNPLFNDNRLKLGMFGLNAGHHILTKAPDRYLADWDRCNAICATADRLGLEASVSLIGWNQSPELEPFTWAAGLSAHHRRTAFISTMHVQLMHPVFVAKAAATVDRISGGRFGINIVAGANPVTFESFGMKIEDHEARYAHAEEFMQLLKRLWSEDEPFSFEGRFYRIGNVRSVPKPIQSFPAIMNAGTSTRGRDFACQYADMVFTHVAADPDQARSQIAEFRELAHSRHGRSIQVWTHGYVVIRDTQEEADDFLRYYAVEHADNEAVAHFVKALGMSAQSIDEKDRWKFNRQWAAGGGVALVGTGERVAQTLNHLADIGVDGVLLATIEPEKTLDHVGRVLLPLLEQAGLRRFRPRS